MTFRSPNDVLIGASAPGADAIAMDAAAQRAVSRRCQGDVMRAVRAKVVKGKIVTRAKSPEDTKLFLVVDEPTAPIELDAEDEAAIERALASTRAGKTISLAEFRTILNRRWAFHR